MSIRVSSDRNSPVSEHFFHLHKILRRITLLLLFVLLIWTYFVDDLLVSWSLSHSPSGALSIYGPYDWLEIRWTAIFLLAMICVLPFFCFELRKFARPGLLPQERKWLDIFLLVNTLILPVLLWYVWFVMIPNFVIGATTIDSVENVNAHYDAKELFSLASGISWILLIGFITTLSLSLTRLLGIIDDSRSLFSTKIALISGGILILTLPNVFEGLRVVISVSTILLADTISKTVPSATLGSRNFFISSKTSRGGTEERIAIIDCSCEGACPPIPKDSQTKGIALPICSALCLEKLEQDAVVELAKYSDLTEIVVTGCNSDPIPTNVRSSLDSLGVTVRGLSWMDESLAWDEGWRTQSIAVFLSQFTESSDN